MRTWCLLVNILAMVSYNPVLREIKMFIKKLIKLCNSEFLRSDKTDFCIKFIVCRANKLELSPVSDDVLNSSSVCWLFSNGMDRTNSYDTCTKAVQNHNLSKEKGSAWIQSFFTALFINCCNFLFSQSIILHRSQTCHLNPLNAHFYFDFSKICFFFNYALFSLPSD